MWIETGFVVDVTAREVENPVSNVIEENSPPANTTCRISIAIDTCLCASFAKSHLTRPRNCDDPMITQSKRTHRYLSYTATFKMHKLSFIERGLQCGLQSVTEPSPLAGKSRIPDWRDIDYAVVRVRGRPLRRFPRSCRPSGILLGHTLE